MKFSRGSILRALLLLPYCWSCTTVIAAPPTAPTPDKFTVALFHFDEKEGDRMMDAAGHGASGMKGKSAEWASDRGRFKGALRIHARKDGGVAMPSLSIPTDKMDEQAFAIDFWFRLIQDSPIIGRDFYLVSSTSVYFRFAVDRGALEFGVLTSEGWVGCGTSKKDFAVSPNTWYHVAGAYDNSEIRFYLNGKRISWSEGKGAVKLSSLLLGCVGWDSKVTASDFEGLIDELRVSNIPREDFGVHE